MHYLFALLWLPALAWREFRGRFLNRLGFRLPRPRSCIWLHAPSVGEALAIRSFVSRLRDQFPDHDVVLTTFTSGGRSVAKQVNADHHLALPYDLLPSVILTVRRFRPRLFVIVEGDLWPNLLWYLKARRVPVAVVNGRLSAKALTRYRAVRHFAGPLFGSVDAYCIAGADYIPRYLEMGVAGTKLVVTGNLKYDNLEGLDKPDVVAAVRAALGVETPEEVVIAASTHAGEEGIVLDAFLAARSLRPGLRLIVAPRYPERGREVAALMAEKGLKTVLRTSLPCPGEYDVLVLDTLGELAAVYAAAAIAIIGGTFVPRGGQNMVEAAYHGCVSIWGPHVDNFPVETARLAGRGGIAAATAQDLTNALKDLYVNDDVRRTLGEEAAAVAREMMGASTRTLKVIGQLLEASPV